MVKQRVEIVHKLMLNNYPFFVTRQEPAQLKDAPEWYQNRGKRTDGLAEKNMHASIGGGSFPSTRASTYKDTAETGVRRDLESQEMQKMKQTKVANNTVKEKVKKDNLQNLLYEQTAR